jgi:mRNA interferase RelE/StbE
VNYRVQVRSQVWEFAAKSGLQQQRALKRAVLGLAREHGDISALHDELDGFYRLKIGRHRVIFRYLPGRIIECIFVEERRLVYEIFESEMSRIIGAE